MKNPYKSYKMKLTTLSPVFIGGGDFNDYSKLQYVLSNNKLKIINEGKFMNFLNTSKCLENFIKYISTPIYNKKGKIISPNLKNWISDNFGNRELDIYDRIEDIDNLENISNINFIRSFIKNSDNNPYIPGSSIKGAIRTALFSKFIEDMGDSIATEKIKAEMSNIIVSDSKPLTKKDLMYRQTKHQQLISDSNSIKKNGNLKIDYKFMNVDNDLKEILREGIITYFNITLNNKCIYSIEEILEIINNHYKKVLDENKKIDNISSDLKTRIPVANCLPNINIGGQSGLNTKIVLRALSKNEAEYKERKKNLLDKSKQSRKHNHLAICAPRCLRVVRRYKKEVEWYMPLGWCNLSIDKEINVSDITN